MKKILTGLFAFAVFTFSTSAQAQNNAEGYKKERRGYNKGLDKMNGMEKLNLSDAQKQQIKSINEDFKSKMQALDKNDNIMVKDMKAQRKALMQERKNKIAAILTPEQKIQFEQLHKEGNKGDWKNKSKSEDWKKKRKMEDGKEKVKVKTT